MSCILPPCSAYLYLYVYSVGEGHSTIDYLEQPGKLVDNIRDNLYAPMVLALECCQRQIHLTYLGTGCIFKYDAERHRLGSNVGFREADLPNFFGSSYSIVKGFTDRFMHMPTFEGNVLNVRIRMPITADDHPRNFISKITHYQRICSMDNSMTVLPELLPIMIDMMVDREVGTVNLTNPNAVTHNRVLELYREIVDPFFEWQNFSEEEQRNILASDRSNNLLDTSKLQSYAPDVQPIELSIRQVLQRIKSSRQCK